MSRLSRRTTLVALIAWTAATSVEATLVAAQEGVWFVYALTTASVKYGTLAVLAVPVWRTCERLRRIRHTGGRLLGAHLTMGLLVLAVWQSVYYGYLYLVMGSLRPLALGRTAGWQALNAVFTYTLLVALILGQQMSERLRAQEARETQLELLARDARITALKAQIRPHFLFNVLNSIYALIPSQPAKAQSMVERLADLMRFTLEGAEEPLVPLSAELGSVESYLHIEQVRLGDRLRVSFEVAGAPLDALVPPLVFQPLVENAIKHGIAPFSAPGWIEVRVDRCADGIELIVRDSGPGMSTSRDGDGRGLNLTERRLNQIYGQRFALDLHNLEPKGFEARLQIPLEDLDDRD
jgi:two-component system LytT family sensor kinase